MPFSIDKNARVPSFAVRILHLRRSQEREMATTGQSRDAIKILNT